MMSKTLNRIRQYSPSIFDYVNRQLTMDINNILVTKMTIVLALMFSFASIGTGQTTETCDELVCNGDLQISLNVACMLELTPDQLL